MTKVGLGWREVGEADILSGIVSVSDPCYKKDTWCRKNDVHVKPGVYRCYSFLMVDSDYPEFGKRIWTNRIVHSDYDMDCLEYDDFYQVGVDSGLCGYFFNDIKEYPDRNAFLDFCDKIQEMDAETEWDDPTYRSYLLPEGFFTSSGYGDGGYPVFAARNEDGEIVSLEISFIEERDE